MSSRGEAVDRNLERDTVELLLETPELPPERREALARELEAVVALWAEAALRLTEADLKRMERLVAAQTRLLDKAAD